MSIAVPLGVTTPDTSYSDMAAGSDPETVEASPAVCEKNIYSSHNYRSVQSHGYRGLPYADHNYGAPPPPTPPASPPAHTIIPRVELNGLHDRYEKKSEESGSSCDEESDSPWCNCSLSQDGFLVRCDSCRNSNRNAIRVQRRKQDNVSGGESSATESWDEEVSTPAVSYTATQHTPTCITLTVNRLKRSKPKKRKRSAEKPRNSPRAKKIKSFREGSRKSMRMKNSPSEAHALEENSSEDWDNRIRLWTDQYEEAFANQYSADVQIHLERHLASFRDTVGKSVLIDTISKTELSCNNTVLGSQMQFHLGRVARVQKHRKILRAARDLAQDTLIIEYRGKVMLRQQFEANGHFFKKPYPFVLFYSKFSGLEMCVDARTFGNDARFIRRSCTPNAEVRHMIADRMIHLCIYAIADICKDAEITIAFDYEYSNCNYKVDCACHKGNQNCPIQNQKESPSETVSAPSLMLLQQGTETRRRKARRKELEQENQSSVFENSSQHNRQEEDDESAETKEQQEVSEEPQNIKKEKETEDPKLETSEDFAKKTGLLQNLLMPEEQKVEAANILDSVEKQKLSSTTDHSACLEEEADVEAPTADAGEPENAEPAHVLGSSPSGVNTLHSMPDPEMTAEKPVKPVAPKHPRPRPKSRFSRYRSGSSQRVRRQRQASIQQVEQVQTTEEGNASAAVALGEPGSTEGAAVSGQIIGSDGAAALATGSQMCRSNVKYPKTKKYFATEWLNDKVEKPDCSVERPLRITTDPTVLATTLNALPGLSHSPLICTIPKHYIRFGSPFTPERRRRPVLVDGSYGSCKKRWIKQAMEEAMAQVPHSSTESRAQSLYQSSENSNSSISSPKSCELITPIKKRKYHYLIEQCVSELQRPLSPITPPPTDPDCLSPLTTPPCSALPGEEERRCGLMFSPVHSLTASRCNTPLHFELSARPEFDQSSKTGYSDVTNTGSDIQGLPCAGLTEPNSQSCGAALDMFLTGRSLEGQPLTDQGFRTEFNLIYTCSPLTSSQQRTDGLLRGNVSSDDKKPCQSDTAFCSSPTEVYPGRYSQGLFSETVPCPLSPYGERMSDGTRSQQNPPQKKKVSLLEYRKRKQEAKEGGSSIGTPTRSSSNSTSADSESSSMLGSSSRAPSSPQSGFSSPVHSSVPQIEEVSPPDTSISRSVGISSLSKSQDNICSRWMVPTSVERLREGRGVLERVQRSGQRVESSTGELLRNKEPDCIVEGDHLEAVGSSHSKMGTSVYSPHRYGLSPSRYSYSLLQVQSENPQLECQALSQHSMSPCRGQNATASHMVSSPGYGYRSAGQRLGHGLHHNPSSDSVSSAPYSSPAHPTPTDTTLAHFVVSSGYYSSQQHSGGSTYSSAGHLKTGLASQNLGVSSPLQNCTEMAPTDSVSQTSAAASSTSSLPQGTRASSLRILNPGSPGQQTHLSGARSGTTNSSQLFQHRGGVLHPCQLPSHQGSGVRTQSGPS
ncbi:histone-lysine N-methyltransferase SETD5 isoform X2 [Protopterus annectens]|uniref:histone-lysine N-methyltransferase SETD5 isoform X2 n=1 Tax=Protopterus annectens TaxID=7888 RepID=UPI001CFBAF91|nr:histone-lysine N-methyltransferase SETD5 isoform X2 [Protopterus annectens]